MEVKGNLIVHGSFIDIHDNDRVDLRVDKADVKVNGKNIREIEEIAEAPTAQGAPVKREIPASVEKCFKKADEYVREKVEAVVKSFYNGCDANLAMIEVTLYDHGQLIKPNAHKLFLQALMDWGILPKDLEVNKMKNNMSAKMSNVDSLKIGYKQWSDKHINDRMHCIRIGQALPESMPYIR